MAIDLKAYGITGTKEIVYNPSYEFLFKEEMRPDLEGFDKGQLTELDAVNVMTGIYTGRSPKDKFIVMDMADLGSESIPVIRRLSATWRICLCYRKISEEGEEIIDPVLCRDDAVCGPGRAMYGAARSIELAWMDES